MGLGEVRLCRGESAVAFVQQHLPYAVTRLQVRGRWRWMLSPHVMIGLSYPQSSERALLLAKNVAD